VKIAIIGAGVSGLVCAYRLHEDHDIVVYEAADYPGGHSNTIDVETDAGSYAVDTGFIVYNDRNYPNFERLLEELEVPTQPSDMSFGVSDGSSFEYNGSSANGLFARRRHFVSTTFHRMIADLLRFNREDAARVGRRSQPARVARRAGLLGRVRRAPDRAPGLGRVVGRSAPDVVVPRAVPVRVLRQSWDVRLPRPAGLADGNRGVACICVGPERAIPRSGSSVNACGGGGAL
jgi:phytoene dehydrogenase-like protein